MMKRTNSYLKPLLLAAACAVFAAPTQASLVGETFDFSFIETGFATVSDLDRAYMDPGAELAAGDEGNLDDEGILLAGTNIDIFADSIVFSLMT